MARIHGTTDCASRLEATPPEALAGLQRHWFPEMTRQLWRVSTQIGRLAWGFVIAFARDPIGWRPRLLLESRSILRLTRVNGDATHP